MWIKLILLFFAFSFLLRSDQSFNQDLGRHLKLGEIILQSLSVPKTNLFSYTNPDFPFINTHWLFEVFVFLANQSIGLQALLVLKVIIILLSVWITLKIIPGKNQVLLLPIGFIFFHVLRERTDLRPEIFSFLFTSLSLYILTKFSQMSSDRETNVQRAKLIFLLPVIQLIWVNTHIYFFVGLVLQAIFLVHLTYLKLASHMESGKVKLMAIIFGLSVLVSLINPNGLSGLLYPLKVGQNYGYSIVENQTIFFLENLKFKDPNFLFVKITWGIIVISILTAFLRRKIQLQNLLLAIFGGILAFLNVRSFPYLVFLSLPAVMVNFGEIKKGLLTKTLFSISCILLIFESYFYISNSYYKYTDSQYQADLKFSESSKQALDFVLKSQLPGPIFNNFDIGSYIIYRAHPNYRVFIDGRPEAYPASFIQGIYVPAQYDYNKFKILNQEAGFKTIIFSHTDQTPWAANFLKEVIKDKDWSLVYVDDYMVVLIRSEDLEKYNLQEVDLAALNPNLFNFENHVSYIRLAIFLSNTGYIESAGRFIAESLKLFPGSPVANSVIGNPTKNYIFW